ncbi:hypothetical protein GW17_00041417 [Ensete ventricosum]|nr:hypothetical protein GW17_00041417 [Ensete ventricosum]
MSSGFGLPPYPLSEHRWFRSLCASSSAIVSGRSRSSVKWMDLPCLTPEVGCWSGGVRVGSRCLSSGRALTPARRSGRVSSRRDPSDSQVSAMVDFSILLPRRGARAFIVSVVGPSCLITLLLLRLTMSSYLSTMPLVLPPCPWCLLEGVRLWIKSVDLTCVRSAVRPLTRPILASDRLPVSDRPRANCPREQ